jgi:hypothetical protein
MTNEELSIPVRVEDKKPYNAPGRWVYGEIRSITASQGDMMGTADGGSMAFSKTF